MKLIIVMVNPHDSNNPMRLISNDCKTLDDAVEAIFFFMEYCRIIQIEAGENKILEIQNSGA
jgi:hypothetical protein